MSRSQRLYEQWSSDPYFDEVTRAELVSIKEDASEIEERFYKDLEFGTGGIRGILGAGTNRMNRYTIARAAEGFARLIDQQGDAAKDKGIVISYDCRHFSPEFAEVAALVFATHGIKVYLYDELRPTPMLSFGVRYYGAAGGVMITASHNPPQYNGFKAYGSDGGQMPPEEADIVLAEINKVTDYRQVKIISREEADEKGLIQVVGKDIDDEYSAMLQKLAINLDEVKEQEDMKIVFTPLHGTGNKPVRRILREIGFKNVLVVDEQVEPDGDFPTVQSPNPEEREALQMAIDLASKEEADLVIATDPDADRTGLAVRLNDGSYKVLSGNQIGLLLMEYILSAKQNRKILPDNSFAITTIVSTKLTRRVAEHYGICLFETLTGFKFIGEIIKDYDEDGDMEFQFAFEESFGYLAGTDVRDKDAVVAAMLLAEMAATARSEGLTIADYLDRIYEKYGYGVEHTVSISRSGKEGARQIANAMTWLRENKDQGLLGVDIVTVKDYQTSTWQNLKTGESGTLDLSESNVLLYELEGLDWLCVRPSGTEPKIKIYFGVYDQDRDAGDAAIERLAKTVVSEIEKHLV